MGRPEGLIQTLDAMREQDAALAELAQQRPEAAAQLAKVFEQVALVEFIETTGLGIDELSQTVSYTTKNGTVHESVFASVFLDEPCPVGGAVKRAYTENGIEGTQQALNSVAFLLPNFNSAISERTRRTVAIVADPKKKTS